MQLTFHLDTSVPSAARASRCKPVTIGEIRTLYWQLRDIKRVALTLKIHERRVRPHVRDLMREVQRRVRETRLSRIATPPADGASTMVGLRWRCAACDRLCAVDGTTPEPTCACGARAPWLPAPNPFTLEERWPIR